MADDASAFSALRKLKIRDGVMDFVYTDGLSRIMEVVPGFSQVQIRVASSPEAAAASQVRTQFELFTRIKAEVKRMGLKPEGVRQEVVYFNAERPD